VFRDRSRPVKFRTSASTPHEILHDLEKRRRLLNCHLDVDVIHVQLNHMRYTPKRLTDLKSLGVKKIHQKNRFCLIERISYFHILGFVNACHSDQSVQTSASLWHSNQTCDNLNRQKQISHLATKWFKNGII